MPPPPPPRSAPGKVPYDDEGEIVKAVLRDDGRMRVSRSTARPTTAGVMMSKPDMRDGRGRE